MTSALIHSIKIKEKTGIEIKRRTNSNYLKLLGFECSNPIKKPLLKKVHKENRLKAGKV